MEHLARYRGAMLGLACGDAVGTSVEFSGRDTFEPLTDMIGGGVFGLPVGAWTDDTSMALCLATSLIENKGFNPHDQLTRYVRWWKEGYLSSTGHCFDIGRTVHEALYRFQKTGEPMAGSKDKWSAGNGSIMRLAPIPLYFRTNPTLALEMAQESSKTTHGAAEAVQACRLMTAVILKALDDADKHTMLFDHAEFSADAPKIQAIAFGEYRDKSREEILGNGYVVRSLEAALWSIHQTNNFRDAVLMAANLGDDADTTAAVVGQIAGAFYGETAIPESWRQNLVMATEIGQLAEQLLSCSQSR